MRQDARKHQYTGVWGQQRDVQVRDHASLCLPFPSMTLQARACQPEEEMEKFAVYLITIDWRE